MCEKKVSVDFWAMELFMYRVFVEGHLCYNLFLVTLQLISFCFPTDNWCQMHETWVVLKGPSL